MASPFTVFRKNQRLAMAILVGVALLAFVIAPALQSVIDRSYQNMAAGTGAKKTLVSWRGSSVNGEQAQRLLQKNYQCQSFLQRVASEVIKGGGSPKVPGFRSDGRSIDLGLTPNNQIAVLRSQILAAKAKEMGIDFDDSAVDSYLRAFTDGRITTQRFAEMMREQDKLSRFDLYQFLKTEFAANVIEKAAMAGLTDGSMPVLTPGKNWQMFLRFRQRARIEAFPVLVDDFLPQVTGTPSDAELQALFAEGKERPADRFRPEPGFLRRYAADLEFVSGSLEKFVASEQAKLTEEQILKAYEERVKEGRFQVPVPATTEPPAAATPATQPDTTTPEPATPEPAPANTPQPNSPAPEAGTPADPSAASPAPTSSNDGTESEKTPPTGDRPPAVEAPGEPGGGEPAAGDQAQQPGRSAVRLVSFQEQVATEGAVQEPPPASDATTIAAPEEGQPPAPAGASTPAATSTVTPPAMRTQTLDEVRAQLTRDLAMNDARTKMTEALEKVQNQMLTYSEEMQIYLRSQEAGDTSVAKPAPIDLAKVADEAGLTYGRTGMVDADSVQSLPIGRSNVGQASFASQVLVPGLGTYQPFSSNALELDAGFTTYLFWKTEERDVKVPTFSEAKEEVVAAWKRAEARKLAEKKAQDLVGLLDQQTESPWNAVLSETERPLVVQPSTFSWMQPPQSFLGAPFLSTVEGVESPGEEFMRQVFSTPVGKSTVAPNAPKSIYYVARVTEVIPQGKDLQEMFARTPIQMESRQLGFMENQPIFADWYRQLESEMQVKWAGEGGQ
ncbi:MAG: hypothetical protein ACK50O_11995 [Pirellulaceae bacterium]